MTERILVVDDEESVAMTLSALLDREGYQTRTASSLDEALAVVKSDHFDAVLLDLMLAGEDGHQVLAQLHESSPETAAIVLTGYGTLASATHAIQLGVSEYLTKPCPIDDLKAAVSRGLAKRRAILGARLEVAAERERLLAAEQVARAEAEAAQHRLRELFLAAPAFIAVTRGPSHVVEIVNRRFLAMVGRANPEEIVGRSIGDALPELVQAGYVDLADRVYTSGGPFVDPEMPTKLDTDGDGIVDTHWTSLVIQPYRDDAGNIAGLLFHGIDVTERRKAEDALRDSEERFRFTFEQAAVGIAHVGIDGRWLRVNQKLCDILGYPRDALVAHTFQDLTHPDDLAADLTLAGRLLAGEISTYHLEKRYFRGDGTVIWANLTVSLVRDAAGAPSYFISVVQDVTNRKRTEESLQRTSDNLAAVINACPLAMMLLDFEGKVRLWNPACERIFGWTAAEVVGTFLPSISDERRPEYLANLEMVRRGERLIGVETVRQGKGNVPVDIALWTVPVADTDGVVHCLSMIADITERKRAEHVQSFLGDVSDILASSLEYNETLARVARLTVPILADFCQIYVTDDTGHLQRVAVAHVDPAREVLARSLVGRFPHDLATDGPTSEAVRSGRAVLQSTLPHDLLEQIAPDPEHRRVIEALNVGSAISVPLRARGQILGAIVLVRERGKEPYAAVDVRVAEELSRRAGLAMDNARLYAQAREAVQLRDEFLSIAAHELKTPMTGLRGSAQLLLRLFDQFGAPSDERILRRLTVINQQSAKMSRLVDQLLDVTRIEAGRLTLDRAATDVVAVVQGIAAAAQARGDRHVITVQAEGHLIASVDALRLEQVVTNLLDNAIRYSPSGGPIDVVVRSSASKQVTIAVTDHGIGIPPEHRSRVFDRFYQAHAGRHLGGMGLGLYISREIVELHGGTLDAEFPFEGGTRFVVRLPIGDPIPTGK